VRDREATAIRHSLAATRAGAGTRLRLRGRLAAARGCRLGDGLSRGGGVARADALRGARTRVGEGRVLRASDGKHEQTSKRASPASNQPIGPQLVPRPVAAPRALAPTCAYASATACAAAVPPWLTACDTALASAWELPEDCACASAWLSAAAVPVGSSVGGEGRGGGRSKLEGPQRPCTTRQAQPCMHGTKRTPEDTHSAVPPAQSPARRRWPGSRRRPPTARAPGDG
jgi:hypothetical protein